MFTGVIPLSAERYTHFRELFPTNTNIEIAIMANCPIEAMIDSIHKSLLRNRKMAKKSPEELKAIAIKSVYYVQSTDLILYHDDSAPQYFNVMQKTASSRTELDIMRSGIKTLRRSAGILTDGKYSV